MVKLLLKQGANISTANTQNETALHLAAWNGHAAVVELLLAAGADSGRPGPGGETPLLLAADGGHVDVCPDPSGPDCHCTADRIFLTVQHPWV
jgi:ankyrin repeat protein